MRSFRKAAVAAATAVTLTLGTTAVAAADTPDPDNGAESTEVQTPNEDDTEIVPGSSIPANGSSRLSDNLNGENEADGRALFGSSKVNEETGATFDGQPAWAKLLYGLSITGAIGAVVSLIVGPAFNFFVHGPGAR